MAEIDSPFETKAKIGAVAIAEIAQRSFCDLLGKQPEDSNQVLQRWVNAVEHIFLLFAAEEQERWEVVAERVCHFLCPNLKWDEQPPILRLAWEAVSRHIFNMIFAEDDEEFRTASSYDLKEWLVEKAKTL